MNLDFVEAGLAPANPAGHFPASEQRAPQAGHTGEATTIGVEFSPDAANWLFGSQEERHRTAANLMAAAEDAARVTRGEYLGLSGGLFDEALKGSETADEPESRRVGEAPQDLAAAMARYWNDVFESLGELTPQQLRVHLLRVRAHVRGELQHHGLALGGTDPRGAGRARAPRRRASARAPDGDPDPDPDPDAAYRAAEGRLALGQAEAQLEAQRRQVADCLAQAVASAFAATGAEPGSSVVYERCLALALRELWDGPRRTLEIEELAAGAGISERTLNRVRRDLRVIAERCRFGPGGVWWLSLPAAGSDVLEDFAGRYFVRTPSLYGETLEQHASRHRERVRTALGRSRRESDLRPAGEYLEPVLDALADGAA